MPSFPILRFMRIINEKKIVIDLFLFLSSVYYCSISGMPKTIRIIISMIYEAIKALFSYAFHIFYSITVIRHGPMPEGPVLIYANHPNYITDIMVNA
jgi:1-acyl-sn-glycerol-3-phosphate acyltransferase